jgi:hypothetical protein
MGNVSREECVNYPRIHICIAVCDPTGRKDYGKDGPIGICNLLRIQPAREEQYKGGDRDRKQAESQIWMHVNICHLFW